MKKKQLEKKTRELIRNCAKDMRDKISKAVNSGAIDLDTYGDDYELPKIVLCALLKYEGWNYGLHTKEGRKSVENLYQFI